MADVASLVVKVSTDGANKAQSELDKLAKQSGKTESATTSLAKSSNLLNVALSSIAIGTLLKESAKLADTYKLTEGRLSLVTKNTIELATAQQEILKISQNTRQSYADTIDLYTRVTRATQDLGKSQSDILKFTEIVNKSLVVSGASAESSKATIIQLGQALGSGVLQGDELRSILENAPRLAEAIAKGMNKTVGELKTLGEQGKLTAEEVFNAIQKQGDAIDKEFGKMPKTIGQATTQMGNSILELVGTMDKLTGASGFIADKISSLSKIMDDFSSNARVASSSVFEQKTVDDITIKANQIASEIQSLQTKLKENDGALWFGLDDRTQSEYINKIKRLEQQMEQLGQTAVDVLWKTSQGTKSAVLSSEQVKKQVDDALSGYKAYYQAIGDNETVLAIKRREYAEKYKNLTTQQIEAIIDSERDKNNKTEELAKKWAEKKLEIQTEMSIAEQDELAKPFLQLQLEYQKDLEQFKGVMGAKELLAENFNKKYQRLGLDATAKIEEKAQKDKQKDIQKELKLQEENFRIQARQVDLLDDEADKQVALATLEYQRTQASLKAQMELGEVTPQYYDAMMEMEDKLLEKQKQNWTLAGQVVNNVTSQMESSMTDFLDATSENFADFGKMATSILQEVYREIIRISVVKPLVSSLTSGAMSLFGGAVADTTYTDGWASGALKNAKGGAYSSPSLSQYSNQIVDKPTFFAFASGGAPNMGVMGEAGSEAIMPLTRTSNGDLGVKAEGMGLNQVKIQIINESGTQMEVTKTSQTTDVEGMVIQAWISGISKNRYGSRELLGGR